MCEFSVFNGWIDEWMNEYELHTNQSDAKHMEYTVWTKYDGVWCHKKGRKKERKSDDNVSAAKNKEKFIHFHTYDGKIRSIVTVLFGSIVLWHRTVWINIEYSRCARVCVYLKIILFQYVWRWIGRICTVLLLLLLLLSVCAK